MSRISDTFKKCKQEKRTALIVYTTMGYPTIKESELHIENLIKNGADIIELGIPFSDPMADGAVIQEASQLALERGVTLIDALNIAQNIRQKHPQTPLVLFSYYNVILSYGLETLTHRLKEIGIDGVLIVDLPLEEREEILPYLKKNQIDLIPLLSPATSIDRAQKIMQDCGGFAYYMTVRGVTGSRTTFPVHLLEELEAMKKVSTLPLAAGFGISDPLSAQTIGAHADAIVVGSAMMTRLMKEGSASASSLVFDIAKALGAKSRI